MGKPVMKLGNWTDEECFYVDVVDGKRFALVVGPFKTEAEARALLPRAQEEGYKKDALSAFYAWGTCKWKNGYTTGSLNEALGLEI